MTYRCGAILLLLVLAGCATGPAASHDFTGGYMGASGGLARGDTTVHAGP